MNYLEENDETSQMLKNCNSLKLSYFTKSWLDLKRFDSETSHEPPSISNFERLFTTNKYRIIEEPESNKAIAKKITSKAGEDKKELHDEEDQKAADSKKTKQKNESTSKPKAKKQKPPKVLAKDDHSDDVEIIEVPPPGDVQSQLQIPTLDPLGNLLQNPNLSAEQLNSLLNQQTNPNDLLQSYLMLQGTNPSLLAGMQGFDLNQYEKLAQEFLKMGGDPRQYYK